jgi:hypothetical protein
VKPTKKTKSTAKRTILKKTDADKVSGDASNAGADEGSSKAIAFGQPKPSGQREGMPKEEKKREKQTQVQTEGPAPMSDIVAFPKLEKPKEAIVGKKADDKAVPSAEHKRTASIFSEAEITERKRAWNKIAMPLDLQKVAAKKTGPPVAGSSSKDIKPKL